MDLSRFDAAPLIAFIATKETGNGTERTDEFYKDAVRIELTSGLTRQQIADDLGVHCPAGHCEAMSREGGCRG